MNLNSLEVQRYPGWGGVCSFDPATEQVEVHEVEHSPAGLVEVTADVLPDEIAAILALTPHVAENTPWEDRAALAAAVADASAAGLVESWGWCFAEKPINYEPDGDVLWA